MYDRFHEACLNIAQGRRPRARAEVPGLVFLRVLGFFLARDLNPSQDALYMSPTHKNFIKVQLVSSYCATPNALKYAKMVKKMKKVIWLDEGLILHFDA